MSSLGIAHRIAPRGKAIVRQVLSRGWPYRLLRARARSPGSKTVLVYHTLGNDHDDFDAWTVVRAGEFRRQIEVLREHFDIVSLDEAMAPGRRTERPAVVLTFDDGDVGLHRHLLPIIEALRLPVLIYVATRQIEEGVPYWFDRLMNGLQATEAFTVDLRSAGLETWTIGAARGARNWAVIASLLDRLKSVPAELREELCTAALAQAPRRTRPEFEPLAPLSIPQLRELAASPWVTLGAHTHCHSLLDQLPLQAAADSISRSRQLLQSWSGQPVDHFAYPNGNVTPRLERLLADLGFRSAAGVGSGSWDGVTRVHAFPRVPVGRYDGLDRFKLRLVGL